MSDYVHCLNTPVKRLFTGRYKFLRIPYSLVSVGNCLSLFIWLSLEISLNQSTSIKSPPISSYTLVLSPSSACYSFRRLSEKMSDTYSRSRFFQGSDPVGKHLKRIRDCFSSKVQLFKQLFYLLHTFGT